MSRDLNARARVEGAVPAEISVVAASALGDLPVEIEVVLLDLDAGGREMLPRITALRADRPQVRWIGFYSHVDDELGVLASTAGIEALPRGRFWRELADLLSQA